MSADLPLEEWLLNEYRQHLDIAAPASAKGAEWTHIATVPVNPIHAIYIFVATVPAGVHVATIHADYDELEVYVSNALPLPKQTAPRFITPERITVTQ